MTDQLQGRALDESAAIAMGWTVERGYYGSFDRWTSPSGESPSGEFWTGVAFSTDPARIPEMLAWLHDNGKTCVIMASYEDHVTCCGTQHVSNDNIHTKGRTLPEALARLVVAVAAAKGAK